MLLCYPEIGASPVQKITCSGKIAKHYKKLLLAVLQIIAKATWYVTLGVWLGSYVTES